MTNDDCPGSEMRYFDFTLTPADGALHPVDRAIAQTSAVERVSIMHFDTLGDGTGVLLYQLEGDPDVLVPDIEEHPDVIAYDLLDAEGSEFHLYLHIHPGDPADTVMRLAQKYALMIDTPIEFTDRGTIRMTVIGSHDMLREAIDEMPEDLSFTVDQVGSYTPEQTNTLSMLTDRQQEVFQRAVELGYYEIPRRATHEEIADELGVAPSTVDEHLRKAESRVLRGLVG